MSLPVVYKWDDGNAPVLNCDSTRTSLVNIFTKCLVDGYGDKPAAGWTRDFVSYDGRKAVFRPDPLQSNGFPFYIDQSSGDIYVYIGAAEQFVDIATPLFPFGASAEVYHSSTSGGTTTPRPWAMVATEKWVYFWSYGGTTVMPTKDTIYQAYNYPFFNFFFGDFDPASPSDGYNTMLWHGYRNATTGLFGACDALSASTRSFRQVARRFSGVTGAISPAVICPPPQKETLGWGGKMSLPDARGLIVGRPMINDGSAQTIRGWLPRLYALCHQGAYENMETVVVGSDTYLHVMWWAGSTSSPDLTSCANALIKLTGDEL